MEAHGIGDSDIASLVFKMKGMDVLDKESLALVPAGTFSRSLWHAAALSSELSRMLRIQDQIYRQYRAEQVAAGSLSPDNNESATVEVKEETPSMSLLPYKQKSIRRRKYLMNECNSFPGERYKWRAKRSYPIDHGASDDSMEEYRPQKRRFNVPVIHHDVSGFESLDGDDTFCYSRINGKPIFQDRRFKSAEIQVYLLNLINEDRARQIAEVQRTSTNNVHEVDGKIMQIEQFLHACKSELTVAFAITQGLRRHGIGEIGKLISDKAMPEIFRKAGIAIGSNEATKVTPEEINPLVEGTSYGCTVQEFPDD